MVPLTVLRFVRELLRPPAEVDERSFDVLVDRLDDVAEVVELRPDRRPR